MVVLSTIVWMLTGMFLAGCLAVFLVKNDYRFAGGLCAFFGGAYGYYMLSLLLR